MRQLIRQLTGASGAVTAEIGVAEHIVRLTRQRLKDAGSNDAVDPRLIPGTVGGTGPGSAVLRFRTNLRLDRLLALAITAMFSRRDFDSSA